MITRDVTPRDVLHCIDSPEGPLSISTETMICMSFEPVIHNFLSSLPASHEQGVQLTGEKQDGPGLRSEQRSTELFCFKSIRYLVLTIKSFQFLSARLYVVSPLPCHFLYASTNDLSPSPSPCSSARPNLHLSPSLTIGAMLGLPCAHMNGKTQAASL